MIEGRIAAMLDAHGIGWRMPRAALAERHGVSRCDISGYDCIYLDAEKPLLPSPLRPLFFWQGDQFDPLMPPTALQGWHWSRNDAVANWHEACRSMEQWLGPGERDDSSNTKGMQWREGAAAVRLLCFPPRLQERGSINRWHERELRLAHAASLIIETGFLPAPSEQEKNWIAAFEPQFRISEVALPDLLANLARNAASRPPRRESLLSRLLGSGQPEPPQSTPPAAPATAQELCLATRPREYLLEYVRDPPPDIDALYGWAWKSADGEALMFLTDALWVVPLAQISAVHVSRIHPGRGSGYSTLELVCHNPRTTPPEKRIPVSQGSTPGDSDLKGEELAAWLQKPPTFSDDVDC